MLPSPARRSLAALVLLAAAALPARAAIAPLADADITKFVAVQRDLIADPTLAGALCELEFGSASDEEVPDPEGALLGRRIDAHPVAGPLVRRHGLSGQRFAQVAVQIVAQAMAVGIAEQLDEGAKAAGKPATNRSDLLARSVEAQIYVARQAELTELLLKSAALCGDGRANDDESDAEEEPEPEPEG